MTESPTLTFLFTDIEGSTSKWEELPEQMAQAVGRHDALLRDAVHAHHGRIVKTTGDGIYAAFDRAVDGLGAVVDIQLALLDPATTAGVGLRIRCGLHTGPVQARDNDYFGSTINRTARIMNAAHGGQILVSQAIAEQLRDALPADVSLKDLGSVRLKGLATTEAVFQVVHSRLYQNFPALRELEATPNNLPQQLTSFVGREKERVEIEEMLSGTRLLTLLGMGGLGKTRLSLQIGTSVMDAYPDGVWFVDLQTARDDSLVASETARVLGVREEPGRPLMQTLCAHLKTRKLLLIVDNCEQVIDACADVSNAILRAAPEVRILATSRIALRVPGEQTYVVQPLPVPMRNADAETLAKTTSVQLFVERAMVNEYRGFDFRYVRRHRRAAVKRSGCRQIRTQKSRKLIGGAATEAEPGDRDFSVRERMSFQPLRARDEVLGQLGAIDLAKELAAFVIVVWIAADRRQGVWRERHEVLQSEPPCDVLGMRIESPVLVNDEHGGQFRRCLGARVLAEWPDEITPDVTIATG